MKHPGYGNAEAMPEELNQINQYKIRRLSFMTTLYPFGQAAKFGQIAKANLSFSQQRTPFGATAIAQGFWISDLVVVPHSAIETLSPELY
jgi:hypothetical protein